MTTTYEKCRGTTISGFPCQSPPNSSDPRFCQAHVHQAPKMGNQPGRKISRNSRHQSLIKKARAKWQDDMIRPQELADRYGGHPGWWGKIITRAQETPKFLHTKCVAILVGYLNQPDPPQNSGDPDNSYAGGVMSAGLEDLRKAWLKSREPDPEPDLADRLLHDVDRLQERVIVVERMLSEILTTLTEGAS